MREKFLCPRRSFPDASLGTAVRKACSLEHESLGGAGRGEFNLNGKKKEGSTSSSRGEMIGTRCNLSNR